ncbi:MAG: TIGR03936 family radical SAM-associated protein [Eubacteriales bacterium]|nr:TIGR03936 family radical SAM-associated protein [Eubacteriales bacterium]
MSNYVLLFSKKGVLKYTSHLDLLRLFKRAFRRAGIDVAYSEGFNPHPKIGFAQPLSLGYEAENEIIEFTSDTEYDSANLIPALNSVMPEGILIKALGIIPDGKKSSAAANVESARYRVKYDIPYDAVDFDKVAADYMAQVQIITLKRQKKSKQMKETDIRPKIREFKALRGDDGMLEIDMLTDCGSQSNLSPELAIATFGDFAGFNFSRYEVEVSRTELNFPVDYQIEWM